MSTIRDPDRIIDAWLAAGPTRLSDGSRQAIADAARATPQLRRGVVPRSGISRYQVLGLAATVATVALVGVALALGGPRTTEQEPSLTPSTPVTSTAFQSPVYGYSIAVPDGWDVAPAAVRWTAGGRLAGVAVDRFDDKDPTAARPRFVVAAADLPSDVATEAWLEGALRSRYSGAWSGGLKRCSQSGNIAGMPYDDWDAAVLAGHDGWIRDGCGFVDGVVVVGRRAFLFSAEGAIVFDGATTETRTLFDRLVGSFVPWSEPSVADVRRSLTSEVGGYTISVPAGWTATPATAPWVPGTAREGPVVDQFDQADPGPPDYSFSVAVGEIGDGVGLDAWIKAAVEPRRPGIGSRLACARDPGAAATQGSDRWRSWAIAGYQGRRREACGYVDGVVAIEGHAYVFSAEGPFHYDGASPRTVAWFEAFVGSFRPASIDRALMASFTSDIYGYSIEHPVGWTVTRASKPWVPGSLPIRSARSDRFTEPVLGGPRKSVYVASVEIPAGITEDEWIERYVPARRTRGVGKCANGPFMGLDPEGWQPVAIDGHDGRIRRACGYVDAVVTVDRRAYVITSEGAYVYPGASPEAEANFQALVVTIDLHPEAAVNTPSS